MLFSQAFSFRSRHSNYYLTVMGQHLIELTHTHTHTPTPTHTHTHTHMSAIALKPAMILVVAWGNSRHQAAALPSEIGLWICPPLPVGSGIHLPLGG